MMYVGATYNDIQYIMCQDLDGHIQKTSSLLLYSSFHNFKFSLVYF